MTVSVRMDAQLVRHLERAAQRRGVTKSQFIIEAVEQALGLRDAGRLLLEVREEYVPFRVAEAKAGGPADPEGGHSERVRRLLRAQHEAALAEWKPPTSSVPAAPAAKRAVKSKARTA